MKAKTIIVAVLVGAVALLNAVAAARAGDPVGSEPPPANSEKAGGQSLSQAAEDPNASLMSLQLADWYTARFHGLDDEDANSAVRRPVIPFKTGSLNHICRATVPFIADHPVLDSGLSDLAFFDLVVFNESWGRWGVGPVALLPMGGSHRGAEKWAAGPAIGFAKQEGKFLWGVFNQNLFSYAGNDARSDVNVSTLQPILNHGLGHGWSVGSSQMSFAYDGENGRWSSLPLRTKVSKLVKFGKMPVWFSLQYEHDFADERANPEDTIRFTMNFLFPKP